MERTFKDKVNDLLLGRYKDIDNSIYEYIDNNINKDGSKLEIAIEIYILTCKIFKYDINYTLFYKDSYRYSEVTLDKNRVICTSWSIIYKKLLFRYGIRSYTVDYHGHEFIEFIIDNKKYYADATGYGMHDGNAYCLSDFANVKYGFLVDSILPGCNDKDTLEEFYETKYKVYKRNYYEVKNDKINIVCNNVLSKVLKHSNNHSKYENLLYRIKFINIFDKFNIDKNGLEYIVLFKRYIFKLFNDFYLDGLLKIVVAYDFYNLDNICKFIICVNLDSNNYYIYNDGNGYNLFDIDYILNDLKRKNYYFKDSTYIPGTKYNKVYSLYY